MRMVSPDSCVRTRHSDGPCIEHSVGSCPGTVCYLVGLEGGGPRQGCVRYPVEGEVMAMLLGQAQDNHILT